MTHLKETRPTYGTLVAGPLTAVYQLHFTQLHYTSNFNRTVHDGHAVMPAVAEAQIRLLVP